MSSSAVRVTVSCSPLLPFPIVDRVIFLRFLLSQESSLILVLYITDTTRTCQHLRSLLQPFPSFSLLMLTDFVLCSMHCQPLS